jgi:hypothetical protein
MISVEKIKIFNPSKNHEELANRKFPSKRIAAPKCCRYNISREKAGLSDFQDRLSNCPAMFEILVGPLNLIKRVSAGNLDGNRPLDQ